MAINFSGLVSSPYNQQLLSLSSQLPKPTSPLMSTQLMSVAPKPVTTATTLSKPVATSVPLPTSPYAIAPTPKSPYLTTSPSTQPQIPPIGTTPPVNIYPGMPGLTFGGTTPTPTPTPAPTPAPFPTTSPISGQLGALGSRMPTGAPPSMPVPTGGALGAGTVPPSTTPPPVAEPQTNAQLDALRKAYLNTLGPTGEETEASKRLANLIASFRLGTEAISEKPIAMPFITGQQAALERTAGIQAQTLQDQLALLQGQRSGLGQRAGAELGFAEADIARAEAARKPIEVGGSLIDPSTGRVIYQAPGKGTEPIALGPGYRLVDPATGRVIAEGLPREEVMAGLTKDQRSYLNNIQDNARQTPEIKVFNDVRGAFEQGRTAAQRGDGIGDLILLRTLAKITDPTSSVREEEFKTFDTAQGTLPRFGISLTKGMISGDRLTNAARTSFLNALSSIYQQREGAYKFAIDFYKNQASQAGIDGELVYPFYTAPTQTQGGVTQEEYNRLKSDGYTDEEIRSLGFQQGSGGTPTATGMRTDRHNNPTAFTTDVARLAGLREGVDYTRGDPFGGGQYYTARLTGDPIATTIRVIDKIGFYTQAGKPRWTYIDQIPQIKNWGSLSYADKASVIKQMYAREGGSGALA